MIRLTTEAVFAHISTTQNHEFLIKMSYIEINNEVIHDLMDQGKEIKTADLAHSQYCNSID